MSSLLHSPTAASTNPAQPLSSSAAAAAAGGAMTDETNQPMRNYDGTEMRDASGRMVFKSQFLATHPLKADCKERVGYGGKKFTYVSGDGVIRTLNAIFGHGGWSSQITAKDKVLCEKDERGRWNVGYLTSVRVTLLNGVCHEDCGSGEGIDPNKLKAHEKAMKSAVTDAMKRAARHFGERLGNALYVKGAGIRTAPRTNRDALIDLERKDALNLFGDQAVLRANHQSQSPEGKARTTTVATVATTASVTNNTVQNRVQKENNPHNGTTAAKYASNSRQLPNCPVQGQQTASSASAVMPSPIASSHGHRGMVQTHPVHTIGTRPGSSGGHSLGSSGSLGVHSGNPPPSHTNNLHHPTNVAHAPQPPNPMAPPPRPMFNPGAAQYHAGNNSSVGNKRGFDGSSSVVSNGSTNGNATAHANSNNMSDAAKRQKTSPYRQKANPYNNGGGRTSV